MPQNCPNCGAPVTGRRCEYCGTAFAPPGVPDIDAARIITLRTQLEGARLERAQMDATREAIESLRRPQKERGKRNGEEN